MKFQKIKKDCALHRRGRIILFHAVFGSCQFFRGLCVDISGEVADIHMRTVAKKPSKTARSIQLPEQKKTIHMTSMLRKEACSGNIHDLAHIPS